MCSHKCVYVHGAQAEIDILKLELQVHTAKCHGPHGHSESHQVMGEEDTLQQTAHHDETYSKRAQRETTDAVIDAMGKMLWRFEARLEAKLTNEINAVHQHASSRTNNLLGGDDAVFHHLPLRAPQHAPVPGRYNGGVHASGTAPLLPASASASHHRSYAHVRERERYEARGTATASPTIVDGAYL